MKRLVATALALALGSTAAMAQDSFPSGPVTLIVPYGPGGSTDRTARPTKRKSCSRNRSSWRTRKVPVR